MTSETIFQALLLVKEPNLKDWETRGLREFSVIPRMGEFIALESDERRYLYKVVGIIHLGLLEEPYIAEIYAVRIGHIDAVRQQLFEISEIPELGNYSPGWIGNV
jgi:hypothetical protein